MMTNTKLPIPDAIAQQHSEQLLTEIQYQIIIAGGKISFANYMNLCLYFPGLGYYSAGSHKIGHSGDFTTAPEISSLFSRAFANHIKDVMQQLSKANILEFGAGSGNMATDILIELDRSDSLPNNYFIIEVSADLRSRQQNLIETRIPHLSDLVHWLDRLPNTFIGVVLANEVCDAMPVHRLHFANGNISERYLELNSVGVLGWCNGEISESKLLISAREIQALTNHYDYTTEVNLLAQEWLGSIAEFMDQGAVFIVDYGHSKDSYYHPERTSGTLMCYYQHQGHDDPLFFPGLQDITAHVDFSSLAATAYDHNLDVAGFQSQADFLISGGIAEFTNQSDDALQRIKQAAAIKQLVLPSEMGESFKVLTLTHNLKYLLPNVQLRDQRYRL